MQSRDLFQEDVVQSERNHLKINIAYLKLSEEEAHRREKGFVASIINIPARYLVEKREAGAINDALKVLGDNTGFYLDGDARGANGRSARAQNAAVSHKTYSIQATYLIKNRVSQAIRSWTGSWNTRNKFHDIGALSEFQPLISGRQLVDSLRAWSDGRAIETKINSNEILRNLSTDWEFHATVSLCVVLNLKGYFPPHLRQRHVKVTLSED
jgi:hypothetical protein